VRERTFPTIGNIVVDSCVFDPKYEPETSSARLLFELCDRYDVAIIVPHSVKVEVEHENTPELERRRARQHIYSMATERTPEEERMLVSIHAVLTGNGKPKKMAADAMHVFQAQKYGSAFVTTDSRILKRRDLISRICTLAILRPSEMLAKMNQWLLEWKTAQ
jgi:predicted nucleic acid-binding protein